MINARTKSAGHTPPAMPPREWHPYQPSEVPPPGATLRETLEALDMSQSKLADRTGLTLKHINQIALGHAAISAETAVALERATGVPATLWNNLESKYQDHQIRTREAEDLSRHRALLDQMPLADLRKRGCIQADRRQPGVLLQEVLQFFGVANIDAWEASWQQPAAAFKQSQAFDVKPAAVAAWLRLGELAGAQMRCEPFGRPALKAAIPRLRALTTKKPEEFYPELLDTCTSVGVCLVLVPEIPGARASGASRFLSPSRALVQLSNRGKRNDLFWFAFFHEIGHLLLHSKKGTFIDPGPKYEDKPVIEREADRFAADVLIPAEYEADLHAIRTVSDAAAMAERIGIAPGVVAGRVRRETQQWNFAQPLFEKFEVVEEE